MNKRQKQKQKTREKIVSCAKELFIQKGFLHTTTSEIAAAAGIAHGTLFLHFPAKESLILEIMDTVLEQIQAALQPVIAHAGNLDEIIRCYLDLIEQHEAIFSTKAREMPFYGDELRRKLLFRDAIIRGHFHTLFQQGIDDGIYRQVDIQTALTFFFGAIHYYLSLKQIFVVDGSVIGKFKDQIISTFNALITIPKMEES